MGFGRYAACELGRGTADMAGCGTHPSRSRLDTYEHMVPGQEADTVARLAGMMGTQGEAIRATGTDSTTNSTQQYTRRPGHRSHA